MEIANRVLVNLPKSHRTVSKFKSLFPYAVFYGATSLGSGRKSYVITEEEFTKNGDKLKEMKITKAKNQPDYLRQATQ